MKSNVKRVERDDVVIKMSLREAARLYRVTADVSVDHTARFTSEERRAAHALHFALNKLYSEFKGL